MNLNPCIDNMLINGYYENQAKHDTTNGLKEDRFINCNDSSVVAFTRMFQKLDREVMDENIARSSILEMEQLKRHYQPVIDNLDKKERTRANELMLGFIQAITKRNFQRQVSFSIDRYTDKRIIVRFKQRADLRVTLNFTEPDYLDEVCTIKNVEVAYLSYLEGNNRHILNSSLSVIIDELCNLL